MRIHEYLEIDQSGNIRCLKCGHVFCSAKENYKNHALRAERTGSEIGAHMIQEDKFTVYHEFYCPGCATLLCVDNLPRGYPPLWDTQIKI